jgi:sarcosine oxidase subunit beta
MSWPDQEVLGRSARVPTLSRLAAGGYDRPVASAFAFCSMPAGDALLGTSLAPSLRDAVEGLDMPELLARRALAAAPGLGDLEVLAAWWGMRPMTPDGMPIAGGTGVEGVYLHGGHASIGMMAAPAMAGWLAEQIVSGKPAPELRELSPERFEGRETQPRG